MKYSYCRNARLGKRYRASVPEIASVPGLALILGLSLSLMAASCASSPGDRELSIAAEADFSRLALLELKLPELIAAPDPVALQSLRAETEVLEKTQVVDAVFHARLAALEGELALLSGDSLLASRHLATARAADAAEERVAFLAARLERDPAAREKLLRKAISESGSGLLARNSAQSSSALLQAELGSTLFELGRFGDSVAAFDEALPSLPDQWKTLWSEKRDAAFSRLGTESAPRDLAAYLAMEVLDLEGMAMICQGSSSLLDRLTGARDWKAAKLIEKIQASGYFGPGDQKGGDKATRAQVAYFLWSLVVLKSGDPALAKKYSEALLKVTGSAAKSPVPDLSIDAWYFDAALGCVEREILSLPDGFRFYPEATVSGSAFWRAATRADEE